MMHKSFTVTLCKMGILVSSLLYTTKSFGQLDSFLTAPFKDKKSFTYGLNNRRTILLNDHASIYGIYMGIQYGNRMKHVVTLNSTLLWAGNGPQVRLSYVGFAEEFTFLSIRRLGLISYIHGGFGYASYRNLPGSAQASRRDAVGPLEMGIHLSYGLWDWLQLKGGAGYRIVLPNKNPELNSVYYKVGASVNLRLLKKKLNSQHPK
jgi:hypothetical protein